MLINYEMFLNYCVVLCMILLNEISKNRRVEPNDTEYIKLSDAQRQRVLDICDEVVRDYNEYRRNRGPQFFNRYLDIYDDYDDFSHYDDLDDCYNYYSGPEIKYKLDNDDVVDFYYYYSGRPDSIPDEVKRNAREKLSKYFDVEVIADSWLYYTLQLYVK